MLSSMISDSLAINACSNSGLPYQRERVAGNEFVDDLLEILDLQAKSDVDLIELLGILDEYGTFILLRLLTLCVFILHCQSFDGLEDFECFLFAHGYLLFLWLFLCKDVVQLTLQS